MCVEWNYVRRHDDFLGHYSREENGETAELSMQVHSMAEVFYCLEGVAEFRVEDTVYYPEAGDLILTRAGEVHSIVLKENTPYERVSLCFAPSLLTQLNGDHLMLPFEDRPSGIGNLYHEKDLPTELLQTCFKQIFCHGNQGSQQRSFFYLLSILQAIFDLWCEKEPYCSMEGTASLPVRIINYINQHLFELETPQDLTKVFYLSRSQLYRVFREYTGTSLWEYVKKRRLYSARSIIRCGCKPQQAAIDCKYANYSTFFRAYKKEFGCGPHEDLSVAAHDDTREEKKHDTAKE